MTQERNDVIASPPRAALGGGRVNRVDEVPDGWDDQTVGDSTGSVSRSRVWQIGDRARVVDGPRMLLGQVGTVVEVDVPGSWPVRLYIGRRGFGGALLAAHELEPASSTAEGPRSAGTRAATAR